MGIGGSAGVYVGPARIVRNFDELMELVDGEVLVTSATGESFNSFLHVVGAIVTDHGSFASHAAIMGREMGFPAVVGTVDGTRRIPNGALARVDGKAGTVEIVGFPDADEALRRGRRAGRLGVVEHEAQCLAFAGVQGC